MEIEILGYEQHEAGKVVKFVTPCNRYIHRVFTDIHPELEGHDTGDTITVEAECINDGFRWKHEGNDLSD